MARLHSLVTLLWLFIHSFAMPLAAAAADDDDACGLASDTPQPAQFAVSTAPAVQVPSPSPTTISGPYQHPPIPRPSPSQHLHATLPASHRDHTPAIFGTVIGIMIALFAFLLIARYAAHRRHMNTDPFHGPPKSRFITFRLGKPTVPKKRLSDESWVSPTLPSLLSSPVSPLSQDRELRRYALRRKPVSVTTPTSTPIDTEFGSRLEFANGDPNSMIPVPSVQIPSPVYIPPFSPSSSLSSSSSSPALSNEPLSFPSSNPARLSRLLSSTFRDSRIGTAPARPTTAYLIQTARSYACAYRPSSIVTTSLYTPPIPSARFSGTRSRTGFYPGPTDDAHTWGTVRDTFSTVTTSDTDMTCTTADLRRNASEAQLSVSPFTGLGSENVDAHMANGSVSVPLTRAPMGTALGLKLRLSDASEHARYRLRERERKRQHEREEGKKRECAEQRVSTDLQTSITTATSVKTVCGIRQRSGSLAVEVGEARKEFKLRDSESVLREIGW